MPKNRDSPSTAKTKSLSSMKIQIQKLLLTFALCGAALLVRGQGTAFTYQGRLAVNGVPANGIFSFQFLLRQTTNGAQQGPTLTNNSVAVSNGLFTTTLDFGDYFGTREFALEIGVRTNSSVAAFTILSPNQVIRPAPLSIAANHAELASTVSSVPEGSLPASVVRLDGSSAFAGVVNFNNPANAFAGDGGSLTNLSLASLGAPGSFDYAVPLDYGGAAQYPSGGNGSASVAAGDLNGDGRADLAVANRGSGNITILINTGTGFTLGATIPSHPGAGVVYLADINRDGLPDVLCVNRPDLFSATSDNTITVARNLGNATFAAPSFLNSTPSLTSLAIGDVNGDLWPDLVAGARDTNVVSVFFNNGSGGFPPSPTYRLVTLAQPIAVALADVTGDGRLDLITAHGVNTGGSETNVAVFPGNGTGNFNAPINFGSGVGYKTLAVADINRDGLTDIIVGNGQSGARIDIFTNSGASTFPLHQSLPTSYIISLTVGDFNGDGWPDVAVNDGGFFGYTGMRMMLSDGTGRLAQGLHIVPFGYATVAAGDVDGNGQSELIAVSAGDPGAAFVYSFRRRIALQRGLVVNGATSLRGALFAEQSASFNADVSVSGTANFVGNANVGGGLSFGSRTRQMLNLYDTLYGIGVQNARLYFRTAFGPNDGFAWFKSGNHSDTTDDPGSGGSTLMTLTPNRLFVNTTVGIGTTNPQTALHVYSANPTTTIRLQSSAQPGSGRIEFLSDPQGSVNEWRPGYIQSLDAGGFTGGLGFYLNGSGAGSKFGNIEGMRLFASGLYVNNTVYGGSAAANGVQGSSGGAGSSGVYGENTGQGYGVAGRSSGSGIAVYGDNTNPVGWAGYFNGNVRVTGTINPPSDRNVKRDFETVNARAILDKVAALSIGTWAYTNDANGSRHLGPVAQDFRAAFNLGSDDTSIATVDADGVALAAIQGLNQVLKEKDARIAALEKSMAELKAIVRRLAEKH
jgi:hypothetical protein